MPLISVIMGVYYRKKDLTPLQLAVMSVLKQSEQNFEFLICDDGSNEESQRFLTYLAKKDQRIRLLRHGRKITLSEKLNYCFVKSTGEFIARMDDDDYSYPGRFAQQVSFLKTHSNIGFVGCNVNLNCMGKIVGQRILPEKPTVRDFFVTQPYIHPTLIFRRALLSKVNGYSEEKNCLLCEDYDLLLRLYAAGFRGGNLQEILFDYTIPANPKGSRKMCHRWNETVTRYHRFRDLNVLPEAWPYVIKPIAVGLLPKWALKQIKRPYRYL